MPPLRFHLRLTSHLVRETVSKLQEREILVPTFSESKSSQVADQLNHGYSLASVLGIS